jgi:hypothetical protein
MKTFITTSSALTPLGVPPGRQVHRVGEGIYAGRIAIIFQTDSNTIKLAFADPPHTSFPTPQTLVSNAADAPFATFMNVSGDIYLAYIVSSTNDLAFVKIPFQDGAWSPQTPVTVYSEDDNAFPSIIKLSNGYLLISYSRDVSGTVYVSAKLSTDDGQSFGTVTVPGDTLTGGSSATYSQLIEAHGKVYLFYSDGGTKLAYRDKAIDAGVWNAETVLATTTGLDDRLCAAVSEDGRIGVSFVDSGGLKLREFSGSLWSAEATIKAGSVQNPACAYRSGKAYVLFTAAEGTDGDLLQYSRHESDGFTIPVPLDPRKSYLDRVLVFDDSAGTYQDRTAEAASGSAADVIHTTSGALLADTGDRVFFGATAPFHFLRVLLSTAGTAGSVVWKYWDGQVWKAFTPHSGDWHFSATERDHLLWPDFDSIPQDWQRRDVAGHDLFWVVAIVAGAFSNAPVGTQITAISHVNAIKCEE